MPAVINTVNIDLAEFNVSEGRGFLPDEFPLQRFSSNHYLSWELTVRRLPKLLRCGALRNEVNENIPILSIEYLRSDGEWHLAYVLLSFLTHSYIWESGGPSQILPPQISIPMLKVAAHLGLPPTATYAALSLWNFASIDPQLSNPNIENLRSLFTFTGTRDEEWFYLISVAIEARSAPLIRAMLDAIDAVHAGKVEVVANHLQRFASIVCQIGQILRRMDEHCDPDVFYNDIRPFLAGSKNMQLVGLPRGVFYDLGNEKGQWHMYSGGSNAQSSIIQFFDIILGVEHSSPRCSKAVPPYLTEMRSYMPGPHRAFLHKLESITNIREYVASCPDTWLISAFNLAVNELAKFRDIHMGIATRYIIKPSKRSSPIPKQGLNLAVARTVKEEKLQGTGGTQLLPFLLRSRNDTKEAKLTRLLT